MNRKQRLMLSESFSSLAHVVLGCCSVCCEKRTVAALKRNKGWCQVCTDRDRETYFARMLADADIEIGIARDVSIDD